METHSTVSRHANVKTKQCTKCENIFPATPEYFFRRTKNSRGGLQGRCKSCATKASMVSRQHNGGAAYRDYQKSQADKRYEWKLRTKYGLSIEQYNELRKRQGYKCAICGKKEGAHRFDVDHDHKTGEVRGLLCRFCNRLLLRYLRDDRGRALGLVHYLTNWLFVDEYIQGLEIIHGKGSKKSL